MIALKFTVPLTSGPDTVYKWAEEVDKVLNDHLRQFSRNEGMTFSKILLLHQRRPEVEKDPELIASLEANQWTGSNLLWRRINNGLRAYTIDPTACLALGEWIQRPGHSTILSAYLYYKCFKEGINHVNLEFISEKVFPFGIPTEEGYALMWDMQKDCHNYTNLLDDISNYESMKDLPNNQYHGFRL